MHVPTALRILHQCKVKQLLIGSHVRHIADTVNDDAHQEWGKDDRLTEQNIDTLMESYGMEKIKGFGLHVFESFHELDEHYIEVGESFARAKDPFTLQETDMMYCLDARIDRFRWYGRSLVLESQAADDLEDSEDEDEDDASIERRVNQEYSVAIRTPHYEFSPRPTELNWTYDCGAFELIDITSAEYDELKATKLWWKYYLMSFKPGKRHITDFLGKASTNRFSYSSASASRSCSHIANLLRQPQQRKITEFFPRISRDEYLLSLQAPPKSKRYLTLAGRLGKVRLTLALDIGEYD